MMRIELSKYKFFIILIYMVTVLTVVLIFLLPMGIIALVRRSVDGMLEPFFAVSAVLILFLLFLPIALIFKGKKFVFTEKEILICKGEKLLETIQIDSVADMTYYPYKFGAVCSAIFGNFFWNGKSKLWNFRIELPEKYEVLIISRKSAKKLQKLYPKLVEFFIES